MMAVLLGSMTTFAQNLDKNEFKQLKLSAKSALTLPTTSISLTTSKVHPLSTSTQFTLFPASVPSQLQRRLPM